MAAPPRVTRRASVEMAKACFAQQEAAAAAFIEADTDESGVISKDELTELLRKILEVDITSTLVPSAISGKMAMLSNKEFDAIMDREFAYADTDSDGEVTWDEFVEYYNGLSMRCSARSRDSHYAQCADRVPEPHRVQWTDSSALVRSKSTRPGRQPHRKLCHRHPKHQTPRHRRQRQVVSLQ